MDLTNIEGIESLECITVFTEVASKGLFTRPRVESPRRATLLQANVYKRLHENSSQVGWAPLAG